MGYLRTLGYIEISNIIILQELHSKANRKWKLESGNSIHRVQSLFEEENDFEVCFTDSSNGKAINASADLFKKTLYKI